MNETDDSVLSELLEQPYITPKIDSGIAELLPVPLEKSQVVTTNPLPEKSTESKEVLDDFDLSRTTLRDLLINGGAAVNDLLTITKSTESPRMFEVASALIKTIGETAKDLLEIHKSKKEILDSDIPDDDNNNASGITNIQQAVFVGSTAELQAIIKKPIEKDITPTS